MPTALITGITGQDGSYLTELLLEKGYQVHGIVRRASMFNRSRLEHLRSDPQIYGTRLFLHYADLQDSTSIRRILQKVKPAEVYHFAGQSHVGLSFEIPESTCQEVAMSTLNLLEMCRDLAWPVRFYHAASSEVFGLPGAEETPQTEETAFRPTNPYGCAKAFATNLCQIYRRAYGLFVCSGVAYNHESTRRGENFVTRKITAAAARIKAGRQECLCLGNLDAARDWGYAPEYVAAMWQMLQSEQPDDYVLATGVATTVRDFVRMAFAALNMELEFESAGGGEFGRDRLTGEVLVRMDPTLFRPLESQRLVGCAKKIERAMGWRARTLAPAIAEHMARADWDAQTKR